MVTSFVNNDGGDWILPVMEDIDVHPQKVSVGDAILVRVDANDYQSGIETITLSYEFPSDYMKHRIINLKNNQLTRLWKGVLDVDSDVELGTWELYSIVIEDKAGNILNLNKQNEKLPNTDNTSFIVVSRPV